ncbi:sugar ABC transporter substrate-binding protein [Paraoerskovia sediminicola]|uniref:Sugar ABC transporter substrate-binding protein n=1 Tax=Paraoerskovia sediminicola TaxID=1138587 RepID=A0ABN6XA59_9CELL|nr:sugar ABC transporter substrate-binding protein [Paraoerskovia sediminicola]BDZ41800.1 sugar ABC transporter substrate-binding protein [Paraoerskovia sediminicola]
MSNRTHHRSRRGAALVSGAAVLTLALAACSGSVDTDDSSSGGSGGDGEAATAELVSQEEIDEAMSTPTKLTFWTWVPDIQNQVDMFEAEYPEIDVEVVNVGQGQEHYKKLRSALQAGQGAPDVAQVEFQMIQSFALGDNLLDLTPYLPEGTGDEYVPWVWEQIKSTDGSKVFAVPQDSGPMGLLYRTDLLEDAGIDVPETWDEFGQAARDLREANPDAYLADLPGNDMGQFTALLWQAGARPFGWDGGETVTIDVTSDEATQVAQFWGDLIADDAIAVDPDFNDAWYQGLANGKYAGWTAAAWGPVFLQGTAGNTSGNWGAAPIPQWESGQQISANWGGSSDAVMASSENPIAASQLALWINNDPESTLRLANEQFLFPTLVETLEDPAFVDQEAEFYGGEKVNAKFAEYSTWVDADFAWLPFMDLAYSEGEETVGKAIAEGGDLVAALQAWQDALVAYAEQQGFTVEQ